MSEQPEKDGSAAIAEVSADLTRGLKLCHSLVHDYRLKLAANSNDAESANDTEDESRHG